MLPFFCARTLSDIAFTIRSVEKVPAMRSSNKRIDMKAQAIITADYLDIVYDNRNKAYGSYALRKYADRRMMQAFYMIAAGIIAFSIWTFIAHRLRPVVELPTVISCPITPIDVTPIKQEVPKPKTPEPTPPPAQAPTVKNLPPVIVPNDIVTVAPVSIDSLEGRESGPVDYIGEPDGSVVATTTKPGTGAGMEPVVPPAPAEPRVWSEVMPAYKGDMYAFLSRNIRYPAAAKNSGITGKVLIRFVVNEDGRIHDAKVLRGIGGGCDEEALRVVNAMPAWNPGMQNGNPVKVYFTLPISFMLE